MGKENKQGSIPAVWVEKLDLLESEIRRRDQELERLRSKIDEQADIIVRLQREKKELQHQQRGQETSPATLSKTEVDHYGDHDYWTARRLYVLRQTAKLSYREIAEQTGIPKSTIQRWVNQYRE